MKCNYNGTVLPIIPKSDFPFACISWNTDDTGTTVCYRLCFYDKVSIVDPGWLGGELLAPQGTSYEGYYIEDIDSDAWIWKDIWSGGPTTGTGTFILPVSGSGWEFVWSNINLYKEDGSLAYSGGPDPVPVLNPSVLMQGFMMGDAVKRMRAKRLLHDHTYSAEVTAPTCTEKGYTACTCASCGHRYVSNEVPATGHDYVSEVIDPTTKAQGYTQHTCSRCGDSYTDSYTERLPVAYRYGTVELPALPEYDTTAYPYAFIFTSSSGTTYLYYSNQPFHGYSSVMDLVTNKTDCTMGTYKISDGVWIAGTAPKEYATKAVTTNIPFWANYDVLDSREQLWCAASEPVPIYE